MTTTPDDPRIEALGNGGDEQTCNSCGETAGLFLGVCLACQRERHDDWKISEEEV